MKKGFTIIELIVAMGIFAAISTLAIGAYVTTGKLKAYAGTTRESQQKIRMAQERITRLSRQADALTITTSGGEIFLNLFFKGSPETANQFSIKNNGGDLNLYLSERCVGTLSVAAQSCSSWETATLLLSDDFELDSSSGFVKTGDEGIPVLAVSISGQYGNNLPPSVFFQNDFRIETKVLLEKLK